ncbi:hypothetical protein [Sporosarcina sp. FSL K6-1508]|uniref:hypothetical protein n=1 Tax=Sporosarcina sp. FSL K6-1508 TaxID=2921553 RepID=UPI0030FBAB8C
MKELQQWWNELELDMWNYDDPRSLVEVMGLKSKKYRGLREGAWYDIPNSVWTGFSFNLEKYSNYQEDESSLLFRLSINCKGQEEIDFVSFRIYDFEE